MARKNVVSYDSEGNFYTYKSHGKLKDIIPLTSETGIMFMKEEYNNLFPNKYQTGDVVHRTYNYSSPDFIKCYDPPVNSEIENGLYAFAEVNHVAVMKKKELIMDNYIQLSNPITSLEVDINRFYSNRDLYKSLGLKHRRGALLYGPPGNGKSLHISRLVMQLTDTVCIYIPATFAHLEQIYTFKEGLEGRNVLFIIEEITERTADKELRKNLLEFLDGDSSWNNCYTIATTNYKEKLANNLANRPGRFDLIIEVNNPSESERETYLTAFFDEIPKKWITSTNGLSIAHIREAILRSKIERIPLDESLAKIKEMMAAKLFGSYK